MLDRCTKHETPIQTKDFGPRFVVPTSAPARPAALSDGQWVLARPLRGLRPRIATQARIELAGGTYHSLWLASG
jgi:hypothetical protein